MSTIVRQIEERYRENNLRVKGTETIRLKVKRLVNSCKNFVLKRKSCRQSNAERVRQEKFHRDIHSIFEVAENSVRLNTDQRVGNHPQQRAQQQVDDHLVPYAPDAENQNDPDGDGDPDDLPNSTDSDPDYSPFDDDFEQSPKRKMPVSNTILTQVSQTKGSYRMCQSLLKLGCQIPGANPDNFQLSKTNLWEKITKIRLNKKNDVLSKLRASDCKVVIQFDGKTCMRLNQRHIGSDERLIVLCHTQNGDIPLGFFILNSHSGFDCAMPVINAINNNNLRNRSVGLLCDTENVNTGRFFGACAEIERQLQTQMLHLMCRHHIFEVILKAVFYLLFGSSTGPRVDTFEVLKQYWDDIKNNGFAYAPVELEELLQPNVNEFYIEASDTIGKHAKNRDLRSDYEELNDLVLKFIGIQTEKSFKVPGATNNARWMSRAIYALKTYLFREHLEMDSSFVNLLERFNMFVALIYTKFWNRCSNSADAPANDLQLLKELDRYRTIDNEIAQAALVALKRHLWYLGDELIALSLFSDKVSNDVKDDMVLLMIRAVLPRTENSIKFTEEIEDIQNIELDYFISTRSFFLFDALEINTDFLLHNANTWEEYQSYKDAKRIIHDLIIVVNDGAERALQLGANLIVNQKVRTEERLQNFIVSTFSE